MDFEKILDAWEKKRTGRSSSGRRDMEDLISRYPPKEAKEDHEPANQERPGSDSRNLRNVEPQATLDLHGMNSREAEQALDNFVFECRRRGCGRFWSSTARAITLRVNRCFSESCAGTWRNRRIPEHSGLPRAGTGAVVLPGLSYVRLDRTPQRSL